VRRFLVPEADGPVEPAAPPSFSVLIRTYQSADTVEEAVESALGQTLPPFEVVVYDDGSTDGTGDALRPYRDRIRYLRRENAGAAAAFNGGVDAASGDFVVVLDADDVFEPERIEALSELATARPDLDIVTTDAAWESEGRVVGRFNGAANPFEVENQRGVILERCFIVAPGVRRSTVLRVGGQDTGLEVSADWDCWIRMILGGAKAGSVDEPLLLYRLHEGSVSSERLTSFQHRVDMLEHLRTNRAVRDEDRAALDTALGRHRQTLALARALDAAHRGDADARELALAVARDESHGRKTRLKAAVLAAAPSSVRPRLVDRLGFPPRLARRQVGSSD
jgi:Glycosyl transferase family 2